MKSPRPRMDPIESTAPVSPPRSISGGNVIARETFLNPRQFRDAREFLFRFALPPSAAVHPNPRFFIPFDTCVTTHFSVEIGLLNGKNLKRDLCSRKKKARETDK